MTVEDLRNGTSTDFMRGISGLRRAQLGLGIDGTNSFRAEGAHIIAEIALSSFHLRTEHPRARRRTIDHLVAERTGLPVEQVVQARVSLRELGEWVKRIAR